ncbi:fungal-specific transcription factor domain-containing protein [Aspergillus cavernicola]|uniref:Fungal-specific transcription factor domain-containing protein n=1 Tax=Aspergillus cavernicola TaxID=176166 RepID=A0ABR4I9P1_9EURO
MRLCPYVNGVGAEGCPANIELFNEGRRGQTPTDPIPETEIQENPFLEHALSPGNAISPQVPTLAFEQADEIALYTYYVNRIAGELQAQDGFHNPYRKLSVLSLSFPVLLKTICSCAAEHLQALGRCPAALAVDLQDRAIHAIRSELARWRVDRAPSSGSVILDLGINADEALLAAVLLQPGVIAFSGSSPISVQTHLEIAFYILNDLGYVSNPDVINSFLPKFFLQRFAIVDLGICVWHRRRPRLPLDTWFVKTADLETTPQNSFDDIQPSFYEMTGCPHTVFTFLHRVMHLAADMADTTRPSAGIYQDAITLETEIRLYDLRLCKPAEDSMWRISQSFVHVCLLLLFRRVFMESSCSPRVQNSVRTIFSLLEAVPITSTENCTELGTVQSGVDSATGLPFYLAAREAVSGGDQDWVRKKHHQWRKVYPNLARVQLMGVAEELWLERMKEDWSEKTCEDLEVACDAYLF